jgi:hypothetical protein
MPPPGIAERMISAYAETETWKDQHDKAVLCFEIEEFIAWGNRIFQGLSEDDAHWHGSVFFNQKVSFSKCLLEKLEQLYRDWLTASERIMSTIGDLEGWGFEIRGVEEFRRNCREVRGMFAPDDEFFQSDSLVELRDEAIDEHRQGKTTDCDTGWD